MIVICKDKQIITRIKTPKDPNFKVEDTRILAGS